MKTPPIYSNYVAQHRIILLYTKSIVPKNMPFEKGGGRITLKIHCLIFNDFRAVPVSKLYLTDRNHYAKSTIGKTVLTILVAITPYNGRTDERTFQILEKLNF